MKKVKVISLSDLSLDRKFTNWWQYTWLGCPALKSVDCLQIKELASFITLSRVKTIVSFHLRLNHSD